MEPRESFTQERCSQICIKHTYTQHTFFILRELNGTISQLAEGETLKEDSERWCRWPGEQCQHWNPGLADPRAHACILLPALSTDLRLQALASEGWCALFS